jgi:hypothetical protein
MIKIRYILGFLGASVAISSASLLQSYTAAGDVPSAEGWTFDTSGGGGEITGNSADNGGGSAAGAGNPAWGLWSTFTHTANASLDLAGGALDVGQTLSMDFDNGYLSSPFGYVRVTFESGGRWDAFQFDIEQGSTNYRITDGGGDRTSIPLTYDGVHIEFTLGTLGTYAVSVNGELSAGTLDGATTFDRVLVTSGSNSTDPESYLYFNNVSVIPEPTSIGLLVLGLIGIAGFRFRF